MTDALRAVTRFGLGPSGPDRTAAGGDPRAWVLSQIGATVSNDAPILPSYQAMLTAERGTRAVRDFKRAAVRAAKAGADGDAMSGMGAGGMGASMEAMGAAPERPTPIRDAQVLAVRNALRAAARTPSPFAERWVTHLSNHFTVRGRTAVGVLLQAPYRAEAIEPHAWGRFADLLRATTLHPAMLHDLDNRSSIGPNSPGGQRSGRGANENLARELLELHTLGANGGYTQADIGELSLALTGWRLPPALNKNDEPWPLGGKVSFNPRTHEPGPRTLLGRRFAEDDGAGGQALAIIDHLAGHPSTARNFGRRLAAHFHSPGPGREALADTLADAFRETGGDLSTVAAALARDDAPWIDRPVITTPQGLVTAWMRLVPGAVPPRLAMRATRSMGQMVHTAPSPEGWPEAEEWGSPGGLKTRLDLANELGLRGGNRFDPMALARDALGEGLTDETMTALARAASPAQGLSILAMAPEVMLR